MTMAASFLVLGLVGIMATPAHAAILPDGDPIWYLNCLVPGTPTLDQSNPFIISTCTAAATLTASGLSGATFTVGTGSNMQISVNGGVAGGVSVSGSYSLTDTTTGGNTIGSGTFTGSGNFPDCDARNTVLGFGTAGTGTHVAATDTLRLTISFSSPSGGASLCSGQTLTTNASTSVAIPASAPEFAVAAILPVAIGLFLLKAKVRFWGN